MEFLLYMRDNFGEILLRTSAHLKLTILSVSIAILIGVPIGIFVSYVKKVKGTVLGFASVMQSIPSLALLGFLIPFLGIGTKPAIFMVVIYSLLPIIKNTTTGISNIDKEMVEAARGIGMTNFQILFKVKLPLALPVIMAGIRISAVTSIGLVTLAALIGADGLGYLVYSGIRTSNNMQIIAGAIPACILALVIDLFFALIEKAVTPISLTEKVKTANAKTIKFHKLRRRVILTATSLILIVTLALNVIGKQESDRKIVIGAKDFTEQEILGHMYTYLIENNTDIEVDLKLGLGSQVLFNALESKDMDMYIDYTGTIYGNILKYTERKSQDEVYKIVVDELKEKYNLLMLKPIGFNNTFTLCVTKETASKYNLKTYSDLAVVSKQLKLGAVFEILNRSDGIPNLTKIYNMEFKEMIGIDGTPRYTAIVNDEIQVTDAFSTDGMLLDYDLVVLEDDKEFFPPYYAAPIIREETLKKYPELREVIGKLEGILDDETMRELNYKVDVLKMNSRDVAIEFLTSQF